MPMEYIQGTPLSDRNYCLYITNFHPNIKASSEYCADIIFYWKQHTFIIELEASLVLFKHVIHVEDLARKLVLFKLALEWSNRPRGYVQIAMEKVGFDLNPFMPL